MVYFSFPLSALLLLLTLIPLSPLRCQTPKEEIDRQFPQLFPPTPSFYSKQGFGFLFLCQCLCSLHWDLAFFSPWPVTGSVEPHFNFLGETVASGTPPSVHFDSSAAESLVLLKSIYLVGWKLLFQLNLHLSLQIKSKKFLAHGNSSKTNLFWQISIRF